MSVQIKVTKDATSAKARIHEIKIRTEYPDRAWQAVGRYMAREVDKQFVTRGANFGTPWKPLATSTLIQKRKAGFTAQPLVRTGAMKRGFMYPAIIKNARGSSATFGGGGKVAGYQHFGTKRNGRQHIPARKILKVTPAMRREVKTILARYVIENKS